MEDKRKDEEENSRNARIHSPLHLSQLSSLFSFSWLHELLSSPSLLQTFPWKSLLSLLALRAPIAALEPWARSPFRIRRKSTLLELLKRRTLRIGSLPTKECQHTYHSHSLFLHAMDSSCIVVLSPEKKPVALRWGKKGEMQQGTTTWRQHHIDDTYCCF